MILPEPFQSEYRQLLDEFANVRDTYKYYADGIIPADEEYLRRLIAFLTRVVSHMEIQYDRINLDDWSAFMNRVIHDHTYGDRQDRHNYLESESFDLVSILAKFERDEEDKQISLKQITSIRKKLEKAIA